MTKDEALMMAQDLCPYFDEISKGAFYDGFITALDQFPDTTKMMELVPSEWAGLEKSDMPIDRGVWSDVPDATKWVDELRGDDPWDATDMAYRPNGLNMEQEGIVPSDYSSQAGDYSSQAGDCLEQEPVTWRNAAIRLGEDLYSVGPNGYYDMTASQWLDWALSVVNTAPPKREWQGLTDEDIQDFGYEAEKFDKSNSEWFDRFGFARAIEAKLKEKNHD